MYRIAILILVLIDKFMYIYHSQKTKQLKQTYPRIPHFQTSKFITPNNVFTIFKLSI